MSLAPGLLTLGHNGAQAELARTPHMEERIADIPAIVPLLERLAALTLPLVHMLDPMSVSNIFWALGTLRLSPAGQCHITRARMVGLLPKPALLMCQCTQWWHPGVIACFGSALISHL